MARFRFGSPDPVTPLHYVCLGLFGVGVGLIVGHPTGKGVMAGIVLMVLSAATVQITRVRSRR